MVILCGQTGSGKTTQLPQICLDLQASHPALARGIIGHTQPRRLAARAVAARIAEERGVRLGGLVGVKVRFDDQTSRQTAIKVLTDGMLLAELEGDPELRAYGVVILDEAHERSLNIDFLIGYLRRLLPRRPDLKLIITSATIDPQRFSSAFGGPPIAPVMEVSGRMFPVEIRYRPPSDARDPAEIDFEAVADAVEELTRPSMPPGDVLVFLPGEREIRLAAATLQRRAVPAEVLPLYSRLSNQEQDRIFHPPRDGVRRVILATNVAETSLTVPGIRFVVDTGLARISRYDPNRKVQGLPIEPVSRASADQRSGRCGRVAAGVCIRLYSEDSYNARPIFTDPEIRRSSLASVILRMKALGARMGPIETFPFLDPPPPEAIRDGYETLFELGAVAAADDLAAAPLTELGRRLSRIPVDPRIARVLLAAENEGCMDEAIVLAAALEIQDPRQRPMGLHDQADRAQVVFRHPTSDFLTLLKIWDQYQHAAATLGPGPLAGWCREHFLGPARMREWAEMAEQLRRITDDLQLRPRPAPATQPAAENAIHRALLTGLITNVACREGDGSFDYRGVRGNSVQIFPGSALFKAGPKWIMAAEIVRTTRLYARTVAKVDPAWIEELAGHMFRRQFSDHHLDAESGEPSAWERVTLSGIVVVPRRRAPLAPSDPRAARELFIREGLVRSRWQTSAPFMSRNRAVMEQARAAEAKLRRRNLIIDEADLVAWFDRRIPPRICEPAAFDAWRTVAEAADPDLLVLSLSEVLRPDAGAATDSLAYPDALTLDGPGAPEKDDGVGERDEPPIRLTYALAPGKDDDGITAAVPLISLPMLTPQRIDWLVPGMLPDLVQALIKTLPRAQRAAVEARAPLTEVSSQLADVLTFGVGTIGPALSEALEVLHGVRIDPAAWVPGALPAHLRMRIRVVDEHGKEIAVARGGSELAEVQARLAGRLERAKAAEMRRRFQRPGLTTWDFDCMPAPRPPGGPGQVRAEPDIHPALIDRGSCVDLTLAPSERLAAIQTPRGIRRLLALACRDELDHYLTALAEWPELVRHFAALGTAEQLKADLSCVIAERTFMAGQPPIRTRDEFEGRKAECWGRLGSATREVADIIARTLEPRFRVAQRLSGGTPRLWATSIADIREHAAYLMPRAFLLNVPWERLKHYPRYAGAMRARLLALREDGSGVETAALAKFAPHWKRFTGWVAAAMAEERRSAEASAEPAPSPVPANKGKAPLPQARRAAPTVNLDAGEWAMQPGNLPTAVEQYRWLLEEARVSVFAPGSGSADAELAQLASAWTRATKSEPPIR